MRLFWETEFRSLLDHSSYSLMGSEHALSVMVDLIALKRGASASIVC